MDDFFELRDRTNMLKIARILNEDLPEFCREFFIGMENRTSTLTRLNYAYDLRVFFLYLVQEKSTPCFQMKIKDITLEGLNRLQTSDIERYLSYLSFYNKQTSVKSVYTQNGEKGKARKLASVRAMFRYFFKKGKLSANVAANVETPKIHDKEIVRLEANEVSRLLDVVESGDSLTRKQRAIHDNKTAKRDVALISLLLGTGIRVSECVGLNNRDINMEDNSFVVTRKGGNRVVLYYSDEVKEALSEYLQEKEQDPERKDLEPLFLSLQKKRISVRAAENLVKKYCAIVSPLKKLSPHKMRSTFGTELYRETGDIYMVADVLGHRDVNTTRKHYAAIDENRRRIASTKITLREPENK